MEICSERIRIELLRNDSIRKEYKIKIYPAEKYLSEDICKFTLTVDDSRTGVDVLSLIGELLDSANSNTFKKSIGLFSLFDSSSSIYVDFNRPIIQYSFKFSDLMEYGKLEKNILAFDLFYNGCVHALSLLIMEALSLTRKVFEWEDLWIEKI